MNTSNYHFAIDLLSHLILTKPQAVIVLLGEHGIHFKTPPSKEELIEVVIERISISDSDFITDLDAVLQMHMQHNGQSIAELTGKPYNADENYDPWIGAAIGAVVTVGTTLVNNNQKKKARQRAERAAQAEAKELEALERRNIARAKKIAKQKATQDAKARMEAMNFAKQQAKEANEKAEKQGMKKKIQHTVIGIGVIMISIIGFAYWTDKRNPN